MSRRIASTGLKMAAVLAVAVAMGFVALQTSVDPVRAVDCTGTTYSVAPVHGPTFYIDTDKQTNPNLTNQFVGYAITNNTTSALADGYVALSVFTGGVVELQAGQPSYEPIGSVASGDTSTAFFDLYAAAASATAQGHTITVWSGRPDLPGSTALCQTTWSFTGVQETIEAASNKVTLITASTSDPVVGGTVVVHVEGETGTIGAGTATDPGSFWMSPSALASWPAGSFRLRHTHLVMTSDTKPPVSYTFDDVLRVPNAEAYSGTYTIDYTFDIVAPTNGPAQVYPNQEIASGTQIKHTAMKALPTIPTINPPGGQTTARKEVIPTSVPYGSGGDVMYALPFSSTNPVTLDAIVDDLPPDSAFVAGSTVWCTGSSAPVAVADPVYDADLGGYVFVGPFSVPAGTDSATLLYTVHLNGPVGTLDNSAWGLIYTTHIDTTVPPNDDSPAIASVAVTPAPLTITANNASKVYGSVLATGPGSTQFTTGTLYGTDSVTSVTLASTGAAASAPAGTYAITPSAALGSGLANYAITYVDGTLTVTAASLSVTAPTVSQPYGQPIPTLTPTYSGFVNGETAANLPTAPTCTTTATSSSPPGAYPITCSGGVSNNYSFSYSAGTFTVTQATLTVNASSGSFTYGGTPPAVTPMYTGFVNGDDANDLTTQPTCGTTATGTSDAGDYPSTCSGGADEAYTFTYVDGTVTVDPAALTITASSGSFTYGGTPPAITPIYDGFVNGDDANDLTTQPTCGTTATGTSDAGTYPSTCSGATSGNYTIGYAPGSVTIDPAPLTVTAPSLARDYGEPNPAFTPQYNGFVNGDDAGDLSATATCTTTATQFSAPGSYPITCSGAAGANYSIGYVAGTLTIGTVTLTVTASTDTMTYGGTVPTITPIYSGFVNGDTAAVIDTPPTCSTTATSSSPVGTYPSSCSGASDAYYDFVYLDGSVAVTAADLYITADDQYKNYGETLSLGPGSTDFSVSGLIGSDSVASVTLSSPGAAASADAGTYAITPAAAIGSGLGNYDIHYVDGSLYVDPVELIVTASDDTMAYGGVPPTIYPSYEGFVDDDGPSDLTTLPTCWTEATNASPVGFYDSSCSGAVSDNYYIGYVDGLVEVTPAILDITASGGSMTYGGTVPAIEPIYVGFVNGQDASDLDTAPTCSTDATIWSDVGAYDSSCQGAADANYDIYYFGGTVTVEPAPLTITASGGTMPYGGTVPTITPSYSGFVNGEDQGVLTAFPTCTTTATATSLPGSYPSTCSGAAADNYTIGYVAGTVTIAKVTLTVTASSDTVTYGGPMPAITPSYSGFVGDDDAGDLATPPTCTTTATDTSPAGGYVTTCSGGVDEIYDFVYVDGGLTIDKATLTVTASGGTMVYGGTPPAITPSYGGFVNGDDAGDLATAPTCTTTASGSSHVGSYASTCSGGVDENYAFSYEPGSVSVTPAPLTVSGPNVSRLFGAPDPPMPPSYNGFVNGDDAGDLATAPTCTTTATASSPPGTYPITCSGGASADYSFTYEAGTLTIGGAVLTVTASGGTMTYGGTVPTIGPSYSGFVNGDTAAVLDTPPGCTTAATTTSPVGSYASTCSGAADDYYVFVYLPGTVTVNPAPLTITASSDTMVEGGTVPTITPSYSGFVNGETAAVVTTAPTCTTTATSGSGVGTYASTCDGAAAPNYAMTYVGGIVTVTAAEATPTPSPTPTPTPNPTPTPTPTPDPGTAQISLSISTVQAGGSLGVTGTGYLPDSDVAVTMGTDPTVLCTGHTDANGTFTCTIAVAGVTPAATYDVIGAGTGTDGQPASPTAPLAVTRPYTPPPTATGGGSGGEGDFFPPAFVALALLMAACLAACLRIGAQRPTR